MRLKIKIPNMQSLLSAYNALQGAQNLSAQSLAGYSVMTRFDARLFEVLAEYFARQYKNINPSELNSQMLNTDWPFVMGPILLHSRMLMHQLPASEKKQFDMWMGMVLYGLPQAKGELYFIGLFDFNGKRMQKILERPSKLFLKWGLYHDEVLLNKAEGFDRTTISEEYRKKVLRSLLRRKKMPSVREYRQRLNNQISVRQAQRDLQAACEDIFSGSKSLLKPEAQ